MVQKATLKSKLLVFMLALAVVFTYSVAPMNQAYAASKKPARVTLSKVKAVSASSVKVTWKKAKNAKKYEIYVSTNSKKYFKKAATVKSSVRSYTVKKYNKKALKANKKYYFKVRAVNGKKKGKFSKVKWVRTKKVTAIPDRQVFVDPAYVKAVSGNKNVVLAEVSWGPDAPEKLIPGSVHVDTDSLESNYQDGGFEFWDLRGFNNGYKELIAALESYGITTDTELICYGNGATNSAPTRLAMAALTMGVKKVRVLDGGIGAWTKAGYSTTDKAEIPTVKAFGRTTPLHPEWVISTKDMLDKVKNDPNFKLVSIRSYDEYIGQNSGYAYIDIAGEPKGAIWGHDTDDSSYFINGKTVDTDKLNEYLKPYGASTKNELAFYCGTGWRATIPFLICYEEGIDNMKLWDDGWYVYSGAYADPWNYGDGTVKNGIDFNSYPVQIGDPLKGDVKETTVKALWDAEKYYNPMRGLEAKEETVSAKFKGYYDNFNLMPPKGNIEKSVKFTSSDESVATVDEYGVVEVKDNSAKKTVTITAESNATKDGKPCKTASFTLNVEPSPKDVIVDLDNKTVTIKAVVNKKFVDEAKAVDHLVLNNESKNEAPFTTAAKALDLHAALTAIGAKPWSDSSRELTAGQTLSDVKGDNDDFSHLDVTINGKPIAQFFKYKKNGVEADAADAFDLCFSGNKVNQEAWNTGCVSCAFSCFAGIVSNNAVGFSTANAEQNYLYLDNSKLSGNEEVTIVYTLK